MPFGGIESITKLKKLFSIYQREREREREREERERERDRQRER